MKTNKVILLIILLIAMGLLSYWLFFLAKKLNQTQPQEQAYIETALPRAEEAAYSAEVNQWLEQKQQKHQAYLKSLDTPEGKAKQQQYWQKRLSAAAAQLAEIEFYAKIVDQYGQPVPGVEVTYNALSGYLAPGGGHNKVYSDEQGRFSIEDVRGISLSVYKMSKLNYDFKLDHVKDFGHYKRFPEYRLWTEHSSPEKAFVFKAWKAEPQVKVKSGTTRYYLIPDGRSYSIDLANRFSQFDGKNKGGFNVSFTRSETEWQLVLSAPSGGFIESNEVYMNLAPESGYQETIVLKGERKNEEYVKLKNQYFLKSQKGEFASLSMVIKPYFQDKSFIKLYYAINMSGTRSLVNTVIEPPRFPDPE